MILTEKHKLRRGIFDSLTRRVTIFKRANDFVHIGLIAIGGAVAALGSLGAGGFTIPPSPWAIIALIGIALSTIGTIYVRLTSDSSDHLEKAFESLQKMEEQVELADEISEAADYYFSRSTQLSALYLAFNNARSVFEKAVSDGHDDEHIVLGTALGLVRKDLRTALGFEMEDTWTLVVYQKIVDPNDGCTYLECVAHDRSVDCEISKARRWREGVGVAGMALAKGDEVVAPDITHPAAVSLFSLNGDVLKAEDRKLYRSMFAVPIRVGNDEHPWGVVLASSDQPQHFLPAETSGDTGASAYRAEALRALSGIAALCIAICRRNGESKI